LTGAILTIAFLIFSVIVILCDFRPSLSSGAQIFGIFVQGQLEPECTALTFFAFHADSTFVRFDNSFADRQT
jgi:hypothetical protein